MELKPAAERSKIPFDSVRTPGRVFPSASNVTRRILAILDGQLCGGDGSLCEIHFRVLTHLARILRQVSTDEVKSTPDGRSGSIPILRLLDRDLLQSEFRIIQTVREEGFA